MYPGESNLNGPKVCEDCHQSLETRVCRSQAGYYLGSWCNCGPNSRDSGYFDSKDEADACLREWQQLENTAKIHEEEVDNLPHQRQLGFNRDGTFQLIGKPLK